MSVARLVQAAVDQGLPLHVDDPRTLTVVAGLIRDAVPLEQRAAA
jgi:hypothetical protein